MDEVIDDLISLESGFNDGGLECMEPNMMLQNNVSMNHVDSASQSSNHALTMFVFFFSNATACSFSFILSSGTDSVVSPPIKTVQPWLAWEKWDLSEFEGGLSLEMNQSSLRLNSITDIFKKLKEKYATIFSLTEHNPRSLLQGALICTYRYRDAWVKSAVGNVIY